MRKLSMFQTELQKDAVVSLTVAIPLTAKCECFVLRGRNEFRVWVSALSRLTLGHPFLLLNTTLWLCNTLQ